MSLFKDLSVPTQGTYNHTPHDTTELRSDTIGIVATVTTAGPLAVVFHGDDPTVVFYDLALGTHELRGNFKLVKVTGSTAVLASSRVVVQRFRPYKLKH